MVVPWRQEVDQFGGERPDRGTTEADDPIAPQALKEQSSTHYQAELPKTNLRHNSEPPAQESLPHSQSCAGIQRFPRYPVFNQFDQLLEIRILKQNLIGLTQNGLGGNIHLREAS
jgi:hypothetical protein